MFMKNQLFRGISRHSCKSYLNTMEDQLQLYFDYISQPSRAIYIILKVSGKNFEARRLNLLEGENLNEEFKNGINRFQKVPAIVDGDFRLSESLAILRYFANKQYIPDHLYPANIYLRARADEFLQWQHLGIRSSCSLYFRFLWIQRKVFGEPAEAGKIAKYKNEMERDLSIIENVWLKDNKFIVGDNLTAADVFGTCEVEQAKITGYDVNEKFPKVATWIENVRTELHPYFTEAHQIVYEFEKETKSSI